MLNGFISRNGSSGFSVAMRHPTTGRLGNLKTSSESFEIFRQGVDLLLSKNSKGPICGSDKDFLVKKEALSGARTLTIPLPGMTIWLRENQDNRKRYDATFSIFHDFDFPEGESTQPSNDEGSAQVGETLFNG